MAASAADNKDNQSSERTLPLKLAAKAAEGTVDLTVSGNAVSGQLCQSVRSALKVPV